MEPNPYTRETLSASRLETWREMTSLMARIIDVPVGLIMRVDGPQIEVFLKSETQGNPFPEGHSESYLGSGLYCEEVIRTGEALLIPDARQDPSWDTNPDLEHGLPSYLGLPIKRPDGQVFGTICVLDSKENPYSDDDRALMERFRDVIEKDLALVTAHERINRQEEALGLLNRVLPLCMFCKSVRDEDGGWRTVEDVLTGYSGKRASHGICPTCEPKLLEQSS